MSETRDLGVPLLVLLAGLGVGAWDVAAGRTSMGLLAACLGGLGAWGCLRLTLVKATGRSTYLALGALVLVASLTPVFADQAWSLLPWALAALALALRVRSLPQTVRGALLIAGALLAVGAAWAALAGGARLRPLVGLALAGAFAAVLNVFASRPRAEAPAPEGPLVAVFGGSFDPFHAGHRAITEAMLRFVDRVLLVVAARPPHKQGGREPSPFHHRVAMSRLGVEGLPRTEVLELEARREGPSYTVDTLETLRRLYPPGTRFRLVLGSDSLQEFPLWRDWEGILERADLLVAARPGHDVEPPPEFEGRNAPITRLEMHGLDVSSTEVRRRVAAGEDLGDLLTPAVAAYVRDHGLYRDAAAEGGPSDPPPAGAGASAGGAS